MLNLTFLFAVIIPINGIYGRTQDVDVDTILEIIQAQQQLEQQRELNQGSSDRSDYDSDSGDSRYVTLRSGEFMNLIQEATNEKEKVRKYRLDKQRNYADKDMNNLYKYVNKQYVDSYKNQSFPLEQILEQLLSQTSDVQKPKTKSWKEVTGQILKPNNLLESFNHGDDSLDNLDKYSKIYVILNPQAIQKSKNKNNLTDLISQIVSLSRSANRNKDNRYKGFSFKNNLMAKRSRSKSKEIYSVKNSMEDDYRPKRSRNDRGGGSGSGGRTAIPYLSNRGDIYERDN
ncbi:uncharacterized protein LOC113518029 [Galleria mellonella]|uniref:Uncharacterized protein LOC113518029 n=1 Tax=Galleria mellonella TaxID=7137 RepID=A0A6J3CDI1_GALME|nr:uncharacterized protein LOC113518029 [Galleria mellonella]